MVSLFVWPVKLIGKLQDGTIFIKKGHDGEDDLFEFKTDEGADMQYFTQCLDLC